MSGALGTVAVVLTEAGVGAAVVLWLAGIAGHARRGFLALVGGCAAVLGWSAWALARAGVGEARQGIAEEGEAAAAELGPSAIAAAGPAGDWLLWTLLGFAVAATVWLALLVITDDTSLTRLVGAVTAVVGLAALATLALARGTDVAQATVELVAGTAFLGTAVYGLLLGHWYLFQRRLDERHMRRSVRLYAAGVAAGAAAVALSALNPEPELGAAVGPLLTRPGFSVLLGAGLLAICALIAPFVWRLANEGGRSIQAATGYFYLAVVMALSAEVAAKFRFFF